MQKQNIYEIIRKLKVSDKTKVLFLKMYLLYYPEIEFGIYKDVHSWVHSVNYNSLRPLDKLKFFVDFNLSALFFGPFYYFYKGLFGKGIILLLILFLLSKIPIVQSFWPIIFIYCAFFANKDYFLSVIKKQKVIKEWPDILNGQADDLEIVRILEKDKPKILSFAISIIFVSLIAFFMILGVYKDYSSARVLSNKLVCHSVEDCNYYISQKGYSQETADEYYQVALGYFAKKDYGEAIRLAQNSTRLNYKNVNAYILMGNAYFELQDYNSAIKCYQYALKLNKKLARINYNIGRCYYRMKNYTDAIRYLSTAVKKYPLNPEYKEVLAYSYLGINDGVRAKKELKKAIDIYSLGLTPSSKRRKNTLDTYYKSLR